MKFYLPHAAKTKAVDRKKRPEDDGFRLVGTLSLPHVVCRHMLRHPPLANYAAGKLAFFGLNLHVDAAELLVSVHDDILGEIVLWGTSLSPGGDRCTRRLSAAPPAQGELHQPVLSLWEHTSIL